MGTYAATGIILTHRDVRETDRLVTLYTTSHGQLPCIAKGARKINSKLAGSLEPLVQTQLGIVQGRRFDIITSSDVLRYYHILHSDSRRLALAEYCAHITAAATSPRQPDRRIYALLDSVLTMLDDSGQRPVSQIGWYVTWHILALSGYEPQLDRSVVSKEKIRPGHNVFHIAKGGLAGRDEAGDDKHCVPVSDNTIKILRFILNHDITEVRRLRISPLEQRQIISLTDSFFTYTQERQVLLASFLISA